MSFSIGFTFETKQFRRNSGIENRLEVACDFRILSILGHGSYGRVNRVRHMQSGEE